MTPKALSRTVNMAERFSRRNPRRPKTGNLVRTFFPGEVVRLLKLDTLDYRQLRKLFRLAIAGSGGNEVSARSWSRFGFLEILAARVALDLARPQGEHGPRLRLAQVEQACKVLKDRYKVRRPLLDVRLRRLGASIVAEFSSVQLEPTSGQLLIPEVAEFANRYVQDRGEKAHFSSDFPFEAQDLCGPIAIVVA